MSRGQHRPPKNYPPRPAPVSETAQAPEIEEETDPVGDGPWIETARCTTCNECTQINSRIFAYDDNMQAYFLDPAGGTYREIVEAAESCQVSIIHPGKPSDLQEPNLDELITRAETFS